MCACGAEATANGRECPGCWRERIGSIQWAYAPTRSAGAGKTDRTKSKRWDSRLERYRDTRGEGIQPTSTSSYDIDLARAASDETGSAFRADAAALGGLGR